MRYGAIEIAANIIIKHQLVGYHRTSTLVVNMQCVNRFQTYSDNKWLCVCVWGGGGGGGPVKSKRYLFLGLWPVTNGVGIKCRRPKNRTRTRKPNQRFGCTDVCSLSVTTAVSRGNLSVRLQRFVRSVA